MFRSHGRRQSSRTSTTTTLVREYETVLIESPKKLRVKDGPTKKRNTTTPEPKYNTVLIEPPRKPCTTGQSTKKSTASKKQTNGKAIPAAVQPKTIKSRLDVIRIPCDGPPFRITSLPLITIEKGGIDPQDCVPGEDWLVQFPNMWSLAHEPRFNWHHRHLIGISPKKLSSAIDETYFMYVCYEQTAGVPHNTYLEHLSGFEMYGESFLFKIREFDGDGRPVFRDMGAESVGELEGGGLLETIVRKMLDDMTQKGDEGKG